MHNLFLFLPSNQKFFIENIDFAGEEGTISDRELFFHLAPGPRMIDLPEDTFWN